MSSPLTLSKCLQEAVAAHLATLPGLVGVPILQRRRGNIQADIEAALGGLGACLYVQPALPVEVNPNLSGPYCSVLEVRVQCYEVPTLNTTLPDVYELAELVLTGLHEADVSAAEGLAGANPLQCSRRPIEDVPDPSAVIFELTFTTSVGLPASTAENENE